MIRKLIISILLFIFSAVAFAQQNSIHVEANNQPLNVVLLELRQNYDFQFSYSDNKLSKYKISVDKKFSSKEETVKFLTKGLPLKVKKSGEVFIIIPDKKKEKEVKEKTVVPKTKIIGQIVEAGSFEPLPFSHILINNHQLVSDVMGSFNYIASADSSFHVRISHLGYYVFDTILNSSIEHQFTLTPSTKDIQEITIQNNIIEKATLIGERSGKMKLNHSISRFIPGQGDNSVFNLMRLMPGIQAAGEQSSDLLIWGSYEGQSQITFDEFTLFGLKNYNDNISAVNPFLVKNIEIHKGAYEAKYGNRVGGIVNIIGKHGNRQKPSFSFNLNPTTINGMVEFPLFKKSTFMLAYRQTYYNLYNKEDFNIFAPTRPYNKSALNNQINFDVDVYPQNYKFRDMNFKYTFQGDNGDLFYISTYSGNDYFQIDVNSVVNIPMRNNSQVQLPWDIKFSNIEQNQQRGITTYFSKKWKTGNTKLVLTHSDYSNNLIDSIYWSNERNNKERNNNRFNKGNQAIENTLKIENSFSLNDGNELEFGIGLVNNETTLHKDKRNENNWILDTVSEQHNRAFFYMQDKFNIGSRLSVNSGFRLNLAKDITKNVFEPRVNLNYRLNEHFKANLSWGIFNQFMYKVAEIDEFNNYTYNWTTSSKKRPALKGTHYAASLNYFKNDLTINIEGYYKVTRNILERRLEEKENQQGTSLQFVNYIGNAKTRGIDAYVKKDFGRNSIWASYTLSQAIQSLTIPGVQNNVWEYAPHDQRHEFKVAGIANYKNVYISANYVYGSGMQVIKEIFEGEIDDYSYQRIDVALTYSFNTPWVHGETGLSVLNLLDTQNLKYANIKNIKLSELTEPVRVYSDAVAFTPILFMKLVF